MTTFLSHKFPFIFHIHRLFFVEHSILSNGTKTLLFISMWLHFSVFFFDTLNCAWRTSSAHFLWFYFILLLLFCSAHREWHTKMFPSSFKWKFLFKFIQNEGKLLHRAAQPVMTKVLQSKELKFIENVINAIFLLNFMMNGKWSLAVHINYVFFWDCHEDFCKLQATTTKKIKLCNKFA